MVQKTRTAKQNPAISAGPVSVQNNLQANLTKEIGPCLVQIEGFGTTRSETGGPFSVAQRLGHAFATLTRTAESYQSIGTNVLKAFELKSEPNGSISARLKGDVVVVNFPLPDNEFLAQKERRPEPIPPAWRSFGRY